MSLRLLACLWIAVLFISCEKSPDKAPSDASDEPRATRSSRERSGSAPSFQKELRAGFEEALTRDSAEARDQALAEVVRNSLDVDPSLAAEAFQHLSPDSAEKPTLLQDCARTLLARGQGAAQAWAESLGTEADIAAAKGEIMLALAESDPSRAVEMLSNSELTIQAPDDAAAGVLQSWTASAPADAAAWVASLPQGESRKIAIQTMTSQWISTDSQAAFDWMATLRNPAVRQEATRATVENLASLPSFIRESVLQNADAQLRAEIEQGITELSSQPPDAGAEPVPEE